MEPIIRLGRERGIHLQRKIRYEIVCYRSNTIPLEVGKSFQHVYKA